MSFYGRYLRVDLIGINRFFESDYGFDENDGNPPRLVVDIKLNRGGFTQGKVSIYGLNYSSRKQLEGNKYNVKITAGYKAGGITEIAFGKKSYTEEIKIGTDIILNIYFLGNVLSSQKSETIKKIRLDTLIIEQCNKWGFNVSIKEDLFSKTTINDITLTGGLFKRLKKLQTIIDFDFFEQNNQITFTKTNHKDFSFIEIDITDGLILIPSYTDIDKRVSFELMMNTKIFLGQQFKLTNKYARISLGDDTKTFLTDAMAESISQVKDVIFKVLDMKYALDTMGDEFKIGIEALNIDSDGN